MRQRSTGDTGAPASSTGRRKDDVRLFLWEKFVGHARRQARGAVRARLVDGVAADVRPHGARPARFVGDGLVRAARLRLLVRRHGRLRPLRQDARHLLRHRQRRRRSRRRDRLHRGRRAASSASWPTASRRARCARRCSRSAIRERVVAPRARRVRLDRRRRADARAAAQEAAGVPGEEAPADRPRVRPVDLRARPSGLRGAARRRRVRRRDPRARRFDAQRHLHRHVLEAAGRRSRRRSRCRRSCCAASTTASPRSTT